MTNRARERSNLFGLLGQLNLVVPFLTVESTEVLHPPQSVKNMFDTRRWVSITQCDLIEVAVVDTDPN